ncbi:hypothetical protein OUZ56_026121 [Daphnia magna]|uniref:CCHC-type domain-containing protein n=1 Tax=Daphnia magna TaxID=35525 RepID=A0ABQ9ZKV1_9CRUS|nr:hypothetical protein OUZ56_026121 [Daphnia magna]
MNDDVITGGSRIPRTPIQPSVPQINVPRPSEPTVARSLNFDKLHAEPASSVLRSNGAYEAVARLDLVSRRKPRGSLASGTVAGKRSPSIFARIAARMSPAKSPPKVSPKSSSVAKTVLGFFTRNSPNGKSTEPEPTTSIQQNQEQSTEDIPAQNEPASVPYPCDQEPEGERSGPSVDRSEDLGTANLVDSRHPSIEPLFTRNESNDGVDRTNDSAETSDVDPTGETTRTGEENNPIGSPSVRADIDLHITCETIPNISAESNLLHHGTARRDTAETRDSPSLFSEFWNFNQTPRNTLPTSNVRSERVILPLGSAATDPSTVVPDRRPQLNLLPAGATHADSAGTASSGNQLVAEEIGQLPGSGQPEQRAAGRGDQTNTLPSQGPIATVPTVPYGGGRTSTIRGPTTSTPSRGENPSTTDTSATHRPPPYALRPSSRFDPTAAHTDYTTQEHSRRCYEPRSPTSSVPAQSQTSQQGNLGFRLPVQNNNMAYCTSPTRAATVRDLDDFQNNQHTFSRLQLLPSFTGSPITRFDSWLESFESIVDGSGWSEEKTIQMLRAKLTDRAFSVIQAILKEHPHDYESIKEALLDHFHGDENVDLYLQKFNKAKRKPGEKVVDYALRIQEIFKRAYPVGHSEKSFAVILMQKFIEGLDSKLQTKVKYKEFKDFNELVAATRVYALRLEALETDREKQEFIRSIDGSQDTSSAELKEIKQMIIDQKEAVNKAVANIRHGDKPVVEKKTESEEIKDVLNELMQTVKKLQLNKNDVSYPANAAYRKQVSFQTPTVNQYSNGRPFPPRFPNNSGNRQFSNTQNRPTNATPSFPRSSNDTNNRPTQPSIICNFCGYRGHIQADCRRYQRQQLEQAQPPICYSCRDIGHKSNNCPKFRSTNRPNIPGSPQNQGNQ